MTDHFKENITNDEICELPLSRYNGAIFVIDSLEKFSEALCYLKEETILGFDTETRPSFSKGIKNKIALVQLATAKAVFLIRINAIGVVPEGLTDIFANDKIIKVGVAVHDDLHFLGKRANRAAKGVVDLQRMVSDYGILCASLRKLAAIVLGIRISKQQQTSNWEADRLSKAQQSYAATDAWVCREIYNRLITEKNIYHHETL